MQSINPVFIIVLAGVFAAMWTKLGDRQPSTPVKFALGTAAIGVSFLLFIPMAGGGKSSAPLLGLVGVLLFFLSVALGTAMSGLLTGYYSEQNEVPYFLWLGIAAIVVGAVLLAITKPGKALMGGVH